MISSSSSPHSDTSREHKKLEAILAPPGFGIISFSASAVEGRDLRVLKETLLHSTANSQVNELPQTNDRTSWETYWRTHTLAEKIKSASVVLIGAPSDTGAGIQRGAAYGPLALRETLLKIPQYQDLLQSGQVVDAGDIRVNPHLLEDSMLSSDQIQASQAVMYGAVEPSLRSALPVSPLSQLREVLRALRQLNPRARWMVLGGDHSIAWPITQELFETYGSRLGILQPDAHTDLLSTRLGVKYCFGTWSWHADQLIGGNQKLVQMGIRQSGRDQSHWESTTGVKQYWSKECQERSREEIAEELISHFRSRGVTHLYLSNDIDGTDASFASATGTPVEDGLDREDVEFWIEALSKEFQWVGCDLVEVAPALAPHEGALYRTLETAGRYVITSIKSMLESAQRIS